MTTGEATMRPELKRRRREALDAAERCAGMLTQRFGALRVIPFGSVVGDGCWHDGSDLDLAVEGLSSLRCGASGLDRSAWVIGRARDAH